MCTALLCNLIQPVIKWLYFFSLLFQIRAEGTLNGQNIENQRTTFVKQLKLGKVRQANPPNLFLNPITQ